MRGKNKDKNKEKRPDVLLILSIAMLFAAVVLTGYQNYQNSQITLTGKSSASLEVVSAPDAEKANTELQKETKNDPFGEYDLKLNEGAVAIVSFVLAGVVLLGIVYAKHHEYKKKYKPIHKRYRPLKK